MRTFAHQPHQRRMAAKAVPMRESAIQSAVVQHWRMFGRPHTLVAAIPNEASKGQAGLTKGLPDLIVVGGNVRIGFIELKTPTGRLSFDQKCFRNLCAFVSIPFVDTYGRDEPIAVLERWAVVRPQLNGPVAYRRGDEIAEICQRVRDGQSIKGIAAAFGLTVDEVTAILAGAAS